jgi:hypothetical protein
LTKAMHTRWNAVPSKKWYPARNTKLLTVAGFSAARSLMVIVPALVIMLAV